MRRIFTLVAGLVVVGMLSSAVMAAEKTEKKEAKDTKAATVVGQLTKVDTKADPKSITIGKKKEGKGEEQVIKIDDKTQVMIENESPAAEKKDGDKKPAEKFTKGSISDLKVGQTVRVSVTEGVATKIEIRKAAKKEEKKEKKEEKKATK